jgi:hypothetical protein
MESSKEELKAVKDLPSDEEPSYLGELSETIITRQYKFTISLLQHDYKCYNCGMRFRLASDLGRWNCRYHPGILRTNSWSCCGRPYEFPGNSSSGCEESDHHIVINTMHGKQQPLRLPKDVLDYFNRDLDSLQKYDQHIEMDPRTLRKLNLISIYRAKPKEM